MIRFHAGEFISIIRLVEILSDFIDYRGEFDWSQETKRSVRKDVSELHGLLNKYGLRVSAIKSDKILKQFSKRNIKADDSLKIQIQSLINRIIDELGLQFIYSLDPKEAEYLNNPHKGWEEIISRFPNAVMDVEEMHKCFSFNRYAATIFHSVQVIEGGLIELGRLIEIEDPKSGWTAVTKKLEKILKTEYKDRTPFENQNYSFFEQIHGTIGALKNAWRNKISHVQGKIILMSTEFTPEITEEILFASRAFMRRLADGLPKQN